MNLVRARERIESLCNRLILRNKYKYGCSLKQPTDPGTSALRESPDNCGLASRCQYQASSDPACTTGSNGKSRGNWARFAGLARTNRSESLPLRRVARFGWQTANLFLTYVPTTTWDWPSTRQSRRPPRRL